MSIFWACPSISPLTSYSESLSICMRNIFPKLHILKSSDASLCKDNSILQHIPWTCGSPKQYSCCDMGRIQGTYRIVWRCNWWALGELRPVSVMDSTLKTDAESTSYQPWSATYDSVSSIDWRQVHRWLCFSICRMYWTLLLNWYTSFTLVICSPSELSVLKLLQEFSPRIDSDIWLTRWICEYPKCIT